MCLFSEVAGQWGRGGAHFGKINTIVFYFESLPAWSGCFSACFCGTSVIAEVDQESGRSHSYCATCRGVALHAGRRDRRRSAALQIKCTVLCGVVRCCRCHRRFCRGGEGREGISASSAREHSARVHMRSYHRIIIVPCGVFCSIVFFFFSGKNKNSCKTSVVVA